MDPSRDHNAYIRMASWNGDLDLVIKIMKDKNLTQNSENSPGPNGLTRVIDIGTNTACYLPARHLAVVSWRLPRRSIVSSIPLFILEWLQKSTEYLAHLGKR